MNRQLNDLQKGQTAVVSGLDAQGSMRRRLQDLGLIPGTRVECVGVSPLGDPAAYLIRGALIALRGGDAACISVEHVSAPKKAREHSPSPCLGAQNGSRSISGGMARE